VSHVPSRFADQTASVLNAISIAHRVQKDEFALRYLKPYLADRCRDVDAGPHQRGRDIFERWADALSGAEQASLGLLNAISAFVDAYRRYAAHFVVRVVSLGCRRR
jgi:hypothetical protein